jgi:triosephosphate isomerase
MNPCKKKDALKLFSEIKKAEILSEKKKLKINFIVAPPTIYLNSLTEKNKEKKIKFSGQDIFYKNSGSYTGAISQEMLKDSGADYSIVGH